MQVHTFGNSPIPAVTIYRLRKAAEEGEAEFVCATRWFVEREFYIDAGLKSFSTEEEAICVLKQTQQMLASYFWLHKIISNRPALLEAFLSEDRVQDIEDIDDLFADDLPIQRSLGLSWNIAKDNFTFRISGEQKPFIWKGVVSTVNSLYDPQGFLALVIIQGRLPLRELTSLGRDWDSSPPDHMEAD